MASENFEPFSLGQSLVGRTIISNRLMSDEEMEAMGWYGENPVIFQLDNGREFTTASDIEGNNSGWLYLRRTK